MFPKLIFSASYGHSKGKVALHNCLMSNGETFRSTKNAKTINSLNIILVKTH